MKKTKLPTAEDKIKEFLSLSTLSGRQNRDVETALIEFGKLCAKRALEEAADKAYDKAQKEHRGEFINLNFK